jgi:ribonuclease III
MIEPTEQDPTASQSATTAQVPRAEGSIPRQPFEDLQAKISYTFKDEDYLRNAMVHKSYLHAVPDLPGGSNERLEFLGDSILGFIVSSDLYLSNPDTSEGQLTSWRGALVRLTTLAEIAQPLQLGEYMYMSRGEEVAGGRTRGTSLGRAIEALLGAVYLDGGIEATRAVWHTILGEADTAIARIRQVLSTDFKTQLQQFTQAHLKHTPLYRMVDTSGPDHAKQFRVQVAAGDRVLAEGTGTNKQMAEQAAAEIALTLLKTEITEEEHGSSEGQATRNS